MTAIHDTFTLERTYDASPPRVFEAWANPELKARWFAGPEGWTEHERTSQFRVGGRDVLHGTHPSGMQSKFVARYHEIVENERIVLAYDMLVNDALISVTLATVEIVPTGRSTKLRYTEQSVYFGGRPEEAAARKRGTEALFDNLARAV